MAAYESIQQISKYLSRFSEQVEMLNEIGDFSLNKHAENSLIEMFDLLFGNKFENANSIRKNYPSIDLINKTQKIGIQITATNDLKKLKDCISKYYSNEIYETIDVLYIFNLKRRQKKYDQKGIDFHIDSVFKKSILRDKNKLVFNCDERILDRVELLKILEQRNDPLLLAKIANSLKKQFDKIEFNESLDVYYQNLKWTYTDIVLNDDKGMTLADIYVEPNYSVHIHSLNKKYETEGQFITVDSASIHSYFTDYFFKENSHEDFTKSNIVLLLGYPGQGKTSFCKRILYDYLSASLHKQKDIFYFRVKDISQAKQLISNPITVLLEEATYLTETEVNKHAFRKSILVLDGLDELYMKEDLKIDDIEKLCRELIRECEKFKHLKVIITSRYGYVDIDKLKGEDIKIFRLNVLNVASQLKWVDNYSRFYPENWLTKDKIKEYNDRKKGVNNEYIRELIEQPLLLHIVSSLTKIESKTITQTSIYNQLFTELIERRYSGHGQIDLLKHVTKDDLRELIQEIAFAIYQTGNGYINRVDLIRNEAVQKFLKRFENSDFRDSIKGIMVSFYFTESQKKTSKADLSENYAIEFLHKSLQEFMVAEKILNSIIWEFTNKDLRNNYIVDNYQSAMSKLNDLFANQPISREVQSYLADLIEKVEKPKRDEVVNRICLFLDEMSEKDFLFQFHSNMSSNPIEKSLFCFNSIWFILTNFDKERNYITKNNKNKVAFNFKTLSASYATIAFKELSFQDLSGCDLHSIWGLGSDLIQNANFSDCDLHHSQFIGSYIKECSFQRVDMFEFGAFDTEFFNCNFKSVELTDWTIHNVIFTNVNFSESLIKKIRFLGNENNFKNSKPKHFFNTTFDIESLLEFLRCGAKIDLHRIKVDKEINKVYTYEELVTIVEKEIKI